MSVVNRMLQDIDLRRGAAGVDTQGPYPDIRSVPPRAIRSSRNGRNAWIVGVSIALFAAVATTRGEWREWWNGAVPVAAAPRSIAVALPAAAVSPAEPAVAAGPLALPTPSDPAVEPAIPAVAAEDKPIPKPTLARKGAALPSIEYFKLSLKLSALVADAPTRPVATAGTTHKTNVPVRQVAADETVVAARALWNGGAHADALATLREALVAAEASGNLGAAMPLARELARLEVADNRAQAALDLLRRLESAFGDDADAWALRGNAEQRLALHAEAAESYLAALRLRPAEGKWMLGAAISLAADGKLDEAQAWVDRARDRGAITPPIATYLQQLGIAARR